MPQVLADTSRLQQVMMILLNNAIKHSENNSTIIIKINNYEQGQLCIFSCRVIDSGKGIRERDQANIFKPYYLNDSYEKVKIDCGFGMGLNLCKNIIKKLGG